MAAAGAGAPVIDAKCLLAPENSGAPPPAEVARAIGQACKEWGCFQLVNHGLDLSLTQRMEAAMHAFFALPKEHKLRVPRTATNASGYFVSEGTYLRGVAAPACRAGCCGKSLSWHGSEQFWLVWIRRGLLRHPPALPDSD